MKLDTRELYQPICLGISQAVSRQDSIHSCTDETDLSEDCNMYVYTIIIDLEGILECCAVGIYKSMACTKRWFSELIK